jgi:hypothetical protein
MPMVLLVAGCVSVSCWFAQLRAYDIGAIWASLKDPTNARTNSESAVLALLNQTASQLLAGATVGVLEKQLTDTLTAAVTPLVVFVAASVSVTVGFLVHGFLTYTVYTKHIFAYASARNVMFGPGGSSTEQRPSPYSVDHMSAGGCIVYTQTDERWSVLNVLLYSIQLHSFVVRYFRWMFIFIIVVRKFLGMCRVTMHALASSCCCFVRWLC